MFCAGGLSLSLLVKQVNEAAKRRNIDLIIETYGARSLIKLEEADVLLVHLQFDI